MTRKIPTLNITSNTPIESSLLISTNEFQEKVYEETLLAINDGVKTKKKIVNLFEINNTGQIVSLKKNDWIPSLEKAELYFSRKEQYEKSRLCQLLKEKIK